MAPIDSSSSSSSSGGGSGRSNDDWEEKGAATQLADDWDDWEDEEEGGMDMDEQACKSLFSDTAFPSPEEAFNFDSQKHGFDLRDFACKHSLTDYDCIKCVNFIRAVVKEGSDPLPRLQAGEVSCFADDKWLAPVLQDDGLMFYDYQVEADKRPCRPEGDAAGPSKGKEAAEPGHTAVSELLLENQMLREALAELKWSVLPEELQETEAKQQQPPPALKGPASGKESKVAATAEQQRVDKSYFESYSYFDIHREMLSDKHRTDSYRQALECNPSTVAGKRVLDVGCGTGILSLFAARGGAEAVVGVDGSNRIAGFARRIVDLNGHGPSGSGKVTIVAGKVEELPELPGGQQQVDVIVSEWMGYALLFETMLDSVFAARDRWLRPGGAMLPDRASVFVAAGNESAAGLDFWDDVYGFNMAPIAEEAHAGALKGALVRVVPPSAMLSQPACVKEWDLLTASAQDLDFTNEFRLPLDANPTQGCASLVLWFDTAFSARVCPEQPVLLTTSPHTTPTHWAQTVLPLKAPLPTKGAVAVAGRVSFAARKGACRSLDIAVECWAEMADGSRGGEQSCLY
eukprot:CAMPEP_0117670264 /NCGR_PEP_ID=MMETSP0804-20121206/12640_1 /TAXON_ID=1074897 /ORGANISM="Tetraselmis astigmatica, Strain CCMP880" /LENGTH=572 /DNA_ID=CAMNT_0005478511 /DNA_START=129 /DNA_END=1844 /DNA_ORIENTATION=+